LTQRKKKLRLDELLQKRNLATGLTEANALIRAGKVLVSETVADKPGHLYPEDIPIRTKESLPFVSRGGLKLQGGLNHFNIDPSGWICADIGASTGGFTDCLLQNGAELVYAIDVSYGLLHWKLRTDQRVIVRERLNVRALSTEHMTRTLDFAVFDASFISLATVIPPVLPFFGSKTRILALVKPQFELAHHRVGKGGIVTSENDRLEAVSKIRDFGASHDLVCYGYTDSAIKGAKGNQEYLIYFESR
jgi:23S rRNA (cytidine1920-2'-O)/16S rRNA (cytidine1409-2'-O)-methyltransferase